MTAADDRRAARRQVYIKSLAKQADRAAEKYERQNDKLYRRYLIAAGREPAPPERYPHPHKINRTSVLT